MPEKSGKTTKNNKKPLKSVKFDGNVMTSQNGGITDKSDKSDEEDNIYNENNSEISSDSEVEDYEENLEENNDEIENEDTLGDGVNEIDDEDKGMESEEESVVEEENGEENGEGNDEDNGCLYKFAGKTNIENESDDEIEEEFFDDDNKIYDMVVESSKRITDPILYMFERVRLLAIRSKQLSRGAKPMILNVENFTPKEIAKKELEEKVIPIIIVRTLPNGKKEHWKLNELEIVN
jgi:DNA-directed RNA polymerase subunit K/omega